ncbi:hypothetical protein BKA93DRAFT_299832 [Sparassis latifolia]
MCQPHLFCTVAFRVILLSGCSVIYPFTSFLTTKLYVISLISPIQVQVYQSRICT